MSRLPIQQRQRAPLKRGNEFPVGLNAGQREKQSAEPPVGLNAGQQEKQGAEPPVGLNAGQREDTKQMVGRPSRRSALTRPFEKCE
jgi:hypothetical protein